MKPNKNFGTSATNDLSVTSNRRDRFGNPVAPLEDRRLKGGFARDPTDLARPSGPQRCEIGLMHDRGGVDRPPHGIDVQFDLGDEPGD
jgi:hypothetical protein